MAARKVPIQHQWFMRSHFPPTLKAPLGFGVELWRPVTELPGSAALVAGSARTGIPVAPGYELTANLLPDVLEAALAVLYASDRIRRAVARANRWAKANPPDPATLASPPEFGIHYSHQGIA